MLERVSTGDRDLVLGLQALHARHREGIALYIGFDEGLGIHPQDQNFLDRELWDLSATPPEKHPLLLNYHPLVIYRFQVLKQADVVLALFLQGDHFQFNATKWASDPEAELEGLRELTREGEPTEG